MSDFDSNFWNLFVAIGTLVSIVACAALLMSLSKRKVASDPDKTGHVWDEDLDEYNNPLPQWWIWLFWITIVFSLVYLVLYPGLGAFTGTYQWTSTKQHDDEVALANAQSGPIYEKYAKTDLKQLAADPAAMVIGQKLFLNSCSLCHSSDARGGKGYPNLTDMHWMWGGEPEAIKETIANGRKAVMPPWGGVLGDEGVKDMAHFVMSLNGSTFDSLRAARGKEKFAAICSACHGPDAKGNPAIGAENLTIKVLLHGSDEPALIETISKGRIDTMPAQKEILGDAKVHILAAYVWGLSNKPATAAPAPKPGTK